MYIKPEEKQNLSSPVKGPTRFAGNSTPSGGVVEAMPGGGFGSKGKSKSNLAKELSKRAKDGARKVSDSVMDLAGNLQAMKSVCVNYGLAAALILTMTFANYAAIGSDAWINYVGVWMTSDECQELARASCNSTIQVTSQTKLGGVGLSKQSWTQGAEFYCTDVYREWTKDGGNPYMSIQGTDKECCSQTIRCGLLSAWNLELAFIIGNGGGSMLLLITVLYTTFLYIVCSGTQTDLKIDKEVDVLVSNLRVPFLFLHVLFCIGMGFAFFGIVSVMTIRISTPFFSSAAFVIGVIAACLATVIFFESLYEVYKINTTLENNWPLRKVLKKKREDKQKENDEKLLTILDKALKEAYNAGLVGKNVSGGAVEDEEDPNAV